MEPVCNTTFCSQIDHCVQHITRTCHNKTNVTGTFQNHGCRFYEIFRSFLHGDTPQESNNLLF